MKIINLIFLSYCILEIFPLDNGLGKTPQMGWNTWNKYGCNINSELIEKSITFLANSELYDAGYRYINLDDCWQEEERDSTTNKIVPDRNRFPKDIKMLSGSAHRNNLYLGLYSDAGTKTCAGKAGSLGYEVIDAKTYAEWEIDYLKYDNCYNENKPAKERYTAMRDALKNSNRQIFYSICNWGEEDIPQWGKDVGNSWRTTGDISDMWLSMLRIIDINDQYHQYAGPGGWNDPDMLEVGNGGMSLVEYKTHFSLWSISKAPLIIGCDITNMTKEIKDILINKEVIAINQDSLGEQGRKIKRMYVQLPKDFTPSLFKSEIEVVDCDGSNEQKWYINDDGSIRNNNEDLCMEIPKCVEYDTKMKTDSCHINDKSYCSNSTNQEWIYNKESKQIISKMSPNKCLDIYTHKVTGRSVQTYDCDNTIETQKWEYNEADHTIKTGNKCLSSFKNDEVTEIWGGKLSNDEYALLLVNRASITTKIEVSFEDLNLFDEKKVKLRDLWEKKDLGEFEEKYSVLLESHDSQFLRVTPIEDNSKLIMIIIIALAGVIFICTILVLAFYIKMRKNTPKSLDGLDGNDKFLDNSKGEE